MVADGAFREDLYYRLNVVEVPLPPLRARDNDILLLAQRFTEQFALATGNAVTAISTPAARKLLSYPWPGNVRELRNCMERAVALAQHDKLIPEDLPPRVREYSDAQPVVASSDPTALQTMEEVERRYISHVLRTTGGNKTMAARILGFDRKTLYRKLQKYRIDVESPDSSS
jgi:DNA-binding NtrC family response regulator